MELHIPGYNRVFRKDPDWNSVLLRDTRGHPPTGTYGNPSGPMLEGPCPIPVTDTARWLAPRKEGDDEMKHVIVANMPDGDEALLIDVETDKPGVDPIAALKQAARDFLDTPEGKAYVERTNAADYNWGDLVSSVPDEITEKHGVRITSTSFTHYVVDHDERLVNDAVT